MSLEQFLLAKGISAVRHLPFSMLLRDITYRLCSMLFCVSITICKITTTNRARKYSKPCSGAAYHNFIIYE